MNILDIKNQNHIIVYNDNNNIIYKNNIRINSADKLIDVLYIINFNINIAEGRYEYTIKILDDILDNLNKYKIILAEENNNILTNIIYSDIGGTVMDFFEIISNNNILSSITLSNPVKHHLNNIHTNHFIAVDILDKL